MKRHQWIRRCVVLVAAAALSVTPSIAQSQGGSTGGGSTGGGSTGGGSTGGGSTGGGSTGGGSTGGTTGGTTGRTGRTTDPSQQQQDPFGRETFPEIRRPMFLQGKVVFSDGTPAPPNVVIERFCSGRPIPEGYTDSRGRFSFEVGRNSNFIADASQSGYGQNPMSPNSGQGGFGGFGGSGSNTGLSERELAGCELRAVLAGYRSSSVELTGRRIFDNPDVGQIILTKLGNVEGLTISMTSLQAPKAAKKSYENGLKQAKKEKWDKALAEFESAVATYPEYAEAWYAMGQIHEGMQKPEEAREAYGKALEADGKFMKPYLKLSMMEAVDQKWGEVAEMTATVLKMNPYDFPEAYFLNSMAHMNLNNLTLAEKSAREAIKMNYNRQRPQVEQILGMALAFQNKYEEAAVHLRKYLELTPEANNAPVVKQQLAQLEQFIDKKAPEGSNQADVPGEPEQPQQ